MAHNVNFLPNRRDYYNIEFGTIIEDIGGGGGGTTPPSVTPYGGPYTVIPKAEDEQVLQTKDFLMIDNVTVKEIPFAATSNVAGGQTASIAS